MMTISSLPVPQAPAAAPLPAEAAVRGPLAPAARVRPVAAIPARRPMPDRPRVGAEGGFERLERGHVPQDRSEAAPGGSAPRGSGDFDILQTQGAIRYLAQLLAQEGEGGPHNPLDEHRDGPLLGTEAYRRAGADPLLYSEDPEVFRLAV